MFFYSDTDKMPFNPATAVPYHRQNANRNYLRHYDNYLYLNFIIQKSDNMIERHQAAKELSICERKLRHWYHHANFVLSTVLTEVNKKKKEWDLSNLDLIK